MADSVTAMADQAENFDGIASSRRSLLEATLQALSIGVAVHDRRGLCILANAAALRLVSFDDSTAPVLDGTHNDAGEGRRVIRVADNLLVESRTQALFSDGEEYSLTTFVDVTEQDFVERSLLQKAYIDPLTSLPNRVLIEQHVEALIGSGQRHPSFALAFIDLDNFKAINDYYSHAAGDALLTRLADRVRSLLGPGDMLARVGGDEFLLLVIPSISVEVTQAFVGTIAERLKEPFFVDDQEIFASASIGISLFPDHGVTYDVLRRKADSAMYRAKALTKGGFSTSTRSMNLAATERMAVEQRLRLAIRDRRFCCAYQPKCDIRTGNVMGLEVLLRWKDEQGDIHPPGDFIDLAVDLGLINDITLEVLDQTIISIGEN